MIDSSLRDGKQATIKMFTLELCMRMGIENSINPPSVSLKQTFVFKYFVKERDNTWHHPFLIARVVEYVKNIGIAKTKRAGRST